MPDAAEKWDAAMVRFNALVQKQLLLDDDSRKIKKEFLAQVRVNAVKIRKALEGCDASDPGGDLTTQTIQTFAAAVKKAKKVIVTQVATLNSMIDEQKELKPEQKKTITRGLKLVRAELKALEAGHAARVRDLLTNLKQLEPRRQMNKMEDIEAKEQVRDRLRYKMFVSNFNKALRSSLAKALAAVQRLKASPLPEVYNNEFPEAARTVALSLGNAATYRGNQRPITSLQIPNHIVAGLEAFNTGDLQRIDDGASENDVLGRVRQFSTLVRQVVDQSGKIAADLKKL